MRKQYQLNLLCIVSFMFVFAVFFSLSAEAGIVTDRFPLQMYAENRIDTYNNIGDARRAGWADGGTDLIRVTSINNGWLRVSHPGSGGRTVNRWCKASELFADPGYSNRGVNVRGAQTVYRTSTSGTKFGSVSNNESVIVLAERNNRAQILYRLDNGTGYKAGWVAASAVQSTRSVPAAPSNPIVQPVARATDSYATINGDYYLVPEANSGYALDVAGGGAAPEQTILQLYHKNNSDAQIFHIQPIGGEWHIIQHKRTGHVANVQWGNSNNGTGLWIYHHDGTASCHWRFIKQSNGSYLIQSQLTGNPILELQNNNVYPGGRIQLWARHTGQAGRWRLEPVKNSANTNAPSTPALQENDLRRKLDQLKKNKYPVGSTWTGGGECFGFARQIFQEMHGVYIGTLSTKKNTTGYQPTINQNAGVTCIHSGYIDKNTWHNVLQRCRPGDFIQTSGGIYGTQHSMIFDSYNANARVLHVYEGNWPGNNKINERDISLDNLANAKKNGLLRYSYASIYTKK